MAKAKKLPSGNYRCRARYTDADGVQHSASFTDASAKVAEAQAAMWVAGMIEKAESRKHPSLRTAIDMHLETGRCTGMSPTTIRTYSSARDYAFDGLIDRPIDKITLRDIQAWINTSSKKLAPKTVRNNVALLSVVLKAQGIHLDFSLLKLPKPEHREMEIPSDAQVAQMLDYLSDRDDDMYIAVSLAALMGLRRSEICALKWSDIEVENDVAILSVNKALVKNEDGFFVEKSPKTDAGRRLLVIPTDLYAEMKRRRSLRPLVVGITPQMLTDRYRSLTERLNIPSRFHNLRHYHASVMLREGVPEKYIVADMGHSSFDMVKRVYGHVMQEKRNAINLVMDSHASAILKRSV